MSMRREIHLRTGRPVSNPRRTSLREKGVRRENVRALCLIAVCIVLWIGASYLADAVIPPVAGGMCI